MKTKLFLCIAVLFSMNSAFAQLATPAGNVANTLADHLTVNQHFVGLQFDFVGGKEIPQTAQQFHRYLKGQAPLETPELPMTRMDAMLSTVQPTNYVVQVKKTDLDPRSHTVAGANLITGGKNEAPVGLLSDTNPKAKQLNDAVFANPKANRVGK